MKTLFSIFIALNLSITDIQCQELIYDITISGKKVGSLLVNRKEIEDSSHYYSAVSDVQYTLFRKTQLVYFYEAIFKNDLLMKAYFVYKKNGDVEEEAKLLWSEEGCYLSSLESFNKKHKYMLNKSMVQMYFQKPTHKESIFSERFHDFITVAKVEEENKFIFYIPNGDKSIYHYRQDGLCSKVTINTTFINFEMILASSSNK